MKELLEQGLWQSFYYVVPLTVPVYPCIQDVGFSASAA